MAEDRNKTVDVSMDAIKAAAGQTVDQARKAFEEAMGVAEKTIADLDAEADKVQVRFGDMTRETLDFAGESAEAVFDLIERLSRARSPEEALALQRGFMERQMERLGRRTRVIGDEAIRAAQDMTKPFER